MKIFLDSDVVISSLISKNGASYQLIQDTSKTLFISSISYKELLVVIHRLQIEQYLLENILQLNINTVELTDSIEEIHNNYQTYTYDPFDSHIVAGAHASNASFLVKYNIKHFKIDAIKKDFDIVVLTPGKLLQHLRLNTHE